MAMGMGMEGNHATLGLARHPGRMALAVVVLCVLSAQAVPPEALLDVPMEEFSAPGGNEFARLCSSVGMPCGYEEVPGKKIEHNKGAELRLKKTTPRKVLAEITARYPSYRWSVQDGVLVLEPKQRAGKDLLARKIDHFSIQNTVSIQAAILLFLQAKIPGAGVPSFGDPQFACVDLNLGNVTVREALNAIAKADGQVMWQFSPKRAETTGMSLHLFPWRKSSGVRLTDKHNKFLPIGNPKYQGGCRELEM